jgi:hypothetical protein
LIVSLHFGVNPGDLGASTSQQPQAPVTNRGDINNLQQVCQTGADANSRHCRLRQQYPGLLERGIYAAGGSYAEAQTPGWQPV